MKSKNFIFKFIQGALAYETEIRDIIFILAGVHVSAIFASAALFQTDPADISGFAGAVTETPVAGAEDGPEDALTGALGTSRSLAVSTAHGAGGLGKP